MLVYSRVDFSLYLLPIYSLLDRTFIIIIFLIVLILDLGFLFFLLLLLF